MVSLRTIRGPLFLKPVSWLGLFLAIDKREMEKVYMKPNTAPKREVHGLTFTQNVGVFPRQVSLEIRHTHPALGLNEVAHQRQRHSQVQDNHFTQQPQQQCHYQNLQPQHNVRFHKFCL